MYIVKKEVVHYGSAYGAETEVLVEPYGFEKLDDAINYIVDEAVPEDAFASKDYLDEPAFNIHENGSRDDCETFEEVLDVRDAETGELYVTMVYSIQCIQVRGE